MQAVLAATFLGAGLMKVVKGHDELEGSMPAMADLSPSTVKLTGLAETLGALGLILPAATGIAPVLTPIAASALAVVMLLAAVTHARRREPSAIAVNAVLFALLGVVAWARFGPVAI